MPDLFSTRSTVSSSGLAFAFPLAAPPASTSALVRAVFPLSIPQILERYSRPHQNPVVVVSYPEPRYCSGIDWAFRKTHLRKTLLSLGVWPPSRRRLDIFSALRFCPILSLLSGSHVGSCSSSPISIIGRSTTKQDICVALVTQTRGGGSSSSSNSNGSYLEPSPSAHSLKPTCHSTGRVSSLDLLWRRYSFFLGLPLPHLPLLSTTLGQAPS
ncbi:hypothetical protein CGRA01v4_10163 [Colletotrichum graminicola]|nr:hypothetical protein CGRA01v4_10163 [Colletotrichum graminicola]